MGDRPTRFIERVLGDQAALRFTPEGHRQQNDHGVSRVLQILVDSC